MTETVKTQTDPVEDTDVSEEETVDQVSNLLEESGLLGSITEPEEADKDEEEEEEGDEEEEGETDEEEETDDDEDEDGDDEDDVETQHLDPEALASALGLGKGDIQQEEGVLLIKTKVDGEVKMVPLTKMRENYQLRQHVENKATAVNNEREALSKEVQQKTEQLDAALQQAYVIAGSEMDALKKEADSIDWNTLNTQDPGKFAAAQIHFQNREKEIYGKQAQIEQYMQKVREEADTQYNNKLEEYKKTQRGLLMDKFPQWQDKDTAKKETKALGEFARDTGFSDEEVSSMYDHRIWAVMHKAWLYDQSSDKSKAVKKNLQAKRGKKTVISSKKSRSGANKAGKQVNLKQTKNRAIKTGTTEDQMAYVQSLLK